MKNRRLGRRPLRLAVAALAGAVMLSGCGGGGSGKSADEKVVGDDLSGEPVKVMALAQLGSAADNGNEIAQTAKVTRNWINENGGMNGRPIEVIICNDQNDPDRAAACARQAVEEKVIAVAGSYTGQGDVIVPLLEKAGIPYVAMCCIGGASENSSPISFPFNSGAYGLLAGQGTLAGEVGCKVTSITDAEGPAAKFKTDMMAQGARAGGAPPKGDAVLVNPSGGDYSADVVKIADGADCIMSALSENPTASLLKALQQGGYSGKVKVIGTEGNLTPALTKQFPEVTAGGYNTSFYPPASDAVWDEYWAAWAKYDDPGKFGDKEGVLTGIGALAQWVGLRGMQDIVKEIDGEITAEAVIKAFESQTAFDTHGVTPPIDFTKPFDEKGIERLFNRTITINELVDGKAEWDGKYVDVTPALVED